MPWVRTDRPGCLVHRRRPDADTSFGIGGGTLVVVCLQVPVLRSNKAQELHDRLLDVIDGQGNRHLIIDLRAMTYIDAAGIAVLVDALKRMEQYGGDLVLSGRRST